MSKPSLPSTSEIVTLAFIDFVKLGQNTPGSKLSPEVLENIVYLRTIIQEKLQCPDIVNEFTNATAERRNVSEQNIHSLIHHLEELIQEDSDFASAIADIIAQISKGINTENLVMPKGGDIEKGISFNQIIEPNSPTFTGNIYGGNFVFNEDTKIDTRVLICKQDKPSMYIKFLDWLEKNPNTPKYIFDELEISNFSCVYFPYFMFAVSWAANWNAVFKKTETYTFRDESGRKKQGFRTQSYPGSGTCQDENLFLVPASTEAPLLSKDLENYLIDLYRKFELDSLPKRPPIRTGQTYIKVLDPDISEELIYSENIKPQLQPLVFILFPVNNLI